ncbi:hypothetical protein [Microbacterium sp. MM2322]|uniref:hypothetical protein n=1 Tax=Microbacterium sp. MM2322 TaxID=3157631 RepID=UPI003D8023CB
MAEFQLPDTTFRVFELRDDVLFAIVTTDYADPLDQSRELGKILSIETAFTAVAVPYSSDHIEVPVKEHDEMSGDFMLVSAGVDFKTYHYAAKLKAHPSSLRSTRHPRPLLAPSPSPDRYRGN